MNYNDFLSHPANFTWNAIKRYEYDKQHCMRFLLSKTTSIIFTQIAGDGAWKYSNRATYCAFHVVFTRSLECETKQKSRHCIFKFGFFLYKNKNLYTIILYNKCFFFKERIIQRDLENQPLVNSLSLNYIVKSSSSLYQWISSCQLFFNLYGKILFVHTQEGLNLCSVFKRLR